jgi:hypothetical protein
MFALMFALWLVGKLLSIPLLLDTVPSDRWVWSIPLGVILALVVIGGGQMLSARTALGAPLLEELLAGRPRFAAARRSLSAAVAVAVLGAALTAASLLAALAIDVDPAAVPVRLADLGDGFAPWWKWLLASFDAGVGEELFYRFFLVSLVVWLAAGRPRQQGPPPSTRAYWIGLVSVGLLFGWAHVDDRIGSGSAATTLAILWALTASLGVVLGWLYWRFGLVCAIVAHFLIDTLYYVTLLPALFEWDLTRLFATGATLAVALLVAVGACVAPETQAR